MWQSVRNKRTNVSQTSKDKDARKTAAGVANVNRYEVLSDLDVEDDETTQTSGDVVAEGDLENEQSTSKNINLTQSTSHRKKGRNRETKTNTVIVGDSMINYVKGWKMSSTQNRVTVQSFSGANIEHD